MNKKLWKDFVQKHPQSTFFHQLNWKKVIENNFNFKPHYLIAKNKQGILPLFQINQITGKKLLSLPFSTEGGLLYKNEEAKKDLIQQAKNLVQKNNLDYLELRQKEDLHHTDLKTKDYYHNLTLNLTDKKTLWQNFNKKLRNAIRKAKKKNITTGQGLHYFNDFYKIFSVNMRNLGTPVDKKSFFQDIIKFYPKQVDIIVSKLKDKVISAVFLLKHKQITKAEWASGYREYFGYNANHLMYWRAIQDASQEKFKIFNFGRSIKGEGTYIFKKKFNTQPQQLHYQYYLNNKPMPDIRKTNWKRRIFSKCWSKLPLPLANKLGPTIRKEFP